LSLHTCGKRSILNSSILTGTGAKKIDTLRHLEGSHLQVAVVNYESTWRIEKELSEWLCKGDSLIICDEGLQKNAQYQRFKSNAQGSEKQRNSGFC
jgi:hypothetical protein